VRLTARSRGAPSVTEGVRLVVSTADGVSLLTLVREDWERNGRDWTAPGFQALAVYRLGRAARGRSGAAGKALRLLHRALFLFVRNLYGIEIPTEAVIGRRMQLRGQHGMVFNQKTAFGDDCVYGHNTTIGIGIYGKDSVPRFGDRVELGPGAVILGDVTIGDDVRIGPGALVITDVPAGAEVLERPTRILQLSGPGAPEGRP
jgi:serine O-acetyltransferase